jgi:diguanylate cyclase (GGDEF)-like protein
VRDEHGDPAHLVAQILDINDRKHAEAEVQYLADHDPLTGLWNRRCFEEKLQTELARATRYGHTAAVFVIDLDDFKQINDVHGHKAGDEALRHVARAMSTRVRSTDVVGRLGGDEFAILMPHLSTAESREVVASLMEAIGDETLRFAGRDIQIEASIGTTSLPRDRDDTLEDVMLRADSALYASKADKGRASRARLAGRSPA